MDAEPRMGRQLNLPVFLAAALLVGAAAAALLLVLYEPHTATSTVPVAPMQEHAPGVKATRVETLKPGPGPELRRALNQLDENHGLDPSLIQALEDLGPHPAPAWPSEGILGGITVYQGPVGIGGR